MQSKIFVIDLDGTLIKGQSQMYLIQYLKKNGKISLSRHGVIIFLFILYKLSLFSKMSWLLQYALAGFKNESEETIKGYMSDFFNTELKSRYFTYSKEIVSMIQQSGAEVVVLSAAVQPLVKVICEDLGVKNFISTELEFDQHKIFTGNVVGSQVYGDIKVVNLQKYMKKNNIDPENVTIISDHPSDIPLLEYFKNSIVANPEAKMKKWTRQKQYPVIYLDNNESIQYIKHYIESQ